MYPFNAGIQFAELIRVYVCRRKTVSHAQTLGRREVGQGSHACCVEFGVRCVRFYTEIGLRGRATAGRTRSRVRREESPVFIGQHAG